ncbi:Vegetative incompatibility protein HET-E-1 [Grifola frondosa]|uniref:Vegetative incompatibility protein HET-E-1 n=1 Tax=Grifola frondosa TaxID=5627 RepID=A0A1C7LVA6_GRIFR|nr:Vegetative incompatibility protein HET-E-1 [Grifola frondosa]
MQSDVQIKRLSIRKSDTIALPDKTVVFIRLTSAQFYPSETSPCKTGVGNTWHGGIRPLRIEWGITFEKTFTLEASRTTSPVLELTISFLAVCIGSQIPHSESQGEIPTASTSLRAVADERLPALDKNVQSILESEFIIGPPEWVKKFQKSQQYMEVVVSLVKSMEGLHTLAKLALGALTKAYNIVNQQIKVDDDVRNLASSMEDMLAALVALDGVEKIKMLRDAVERAMEAVRSCADFISEYVQRGFFGRVLNQSKDKINDYTRAFGRLKSCLIADEALQKLPRAAAANYDASLQCLEGTRMDVLNRIFEWIDSAEPGRNMFWLKAIAGSGKSTIASTVASCLESEQSECLHRRILGAAFFCKRDDEELRRPDLVWPTIAFRLAYAYVPLKQHILRSVEANPDIGRSPIMSQFRKLILDPLSSFKRSVSDADDIIIIVIDALDECGNAASREAILRCLIAHADTFPVWVKILVTSRPESDIAESLHGVQDSFPLETWREDQRSDVAKYIRHRIEEIRKDKARMLEDNWPEREKVQELIERSGGLFIWARVSLDFIARYRNPEKALGVVLSQVSLPTTDMRHDHQQLDLLYRTVLSDACKDPGDPSRESQENTELILRVLGSVVVARVPLSCTNLSRLIAEDSFDAKDIVWTIDRLASVLPTHGDAEIVRVIHPSFIDFLTTETRAQEFFVDISEFNISISRASLRLMHKELKRDICEIGDPSLLNTEIPTAKREVLNQKGPLVYCSQFWGDHFADSRSMAEDIVALVELFFTKHLLEWIEVLSLAEALESALPSLAKVEASLSKIARDAANESRAATISLSGCRDAIRFLRYHYPLIRQSALHTYISTLAFTPSKSWIAQQYITKYPQPLRVTVGRDDFWPPQVLVFDGHQEWVLDARFSPDKRNIASIDLRGTIHVWNADSGHTFLTLSYPAHGSYCGSLSFSADGKHLVTQLRGRPTLVWSTETGDEYERRLQEHSGGHVSWSPDGRFIASVDGDGHGIVWDGSNFQIIDKAFQSLKEHPRIWYLEFSSDSKWLATAAEDGSVRIWDVPTWNQVQITKDPTYAEENDPYFRPLAFSPDRRKLAWFTRDHYKVTIWDIKHDTLSHLPIRHADDGSTGYSLAFSPDGSALVVGCRSGLLVVRELETGAILHELQDHGELVNGVEFAKTTSGTMLLSCSPDRTVRLWDVGTVNPSTGSSDEGRMLEYCSISPDGRSLAALVHAGPCFIWDMWTGTKSQLPYVNNERTANLAAFSPDGRCLAILNHDEDTLPADEEKAWHAAVIDDWDQKVKRSMMSFSPDGPQPTHSSDVYQLVGIRTVVDKDGWVYAEKDNSRMRMCYLPAAHNIGPGRASSHGPRIVPLPGRVCDKLTAAWESIVPYSQ